MIMTEEQKEQLTSLQNYFDVIWSELCKLIPEIEPLFSKKERAKIGIKYAAKYKALCDSQQEPITSNCFFDRFAASCGKDSQADGFKDEVNGVANAIRSALKYASFNESSSVLTEIRQIVKGLIITMDEEPSSNNSDYRNRLNELLVFNWLNECENIRLTDVAYPLGNNNDCDFRCIHEDGTELLIEVMTIHNIDLSKQDNSETFSDFINQKVQKKYNDKLKGEAQINNFRILPIIEFVDGLSDFAPILDSKIALPPQTVIKNVIDGEREMLLTPIEKLKTEIR